MFCHLDCYPSIQEVLPWRTPSKCACLSPDRMITVLLGYTISMTIRPVSVIRIRVTGCRMMIAVFFRFHYILGCIRLPHTTLNFPLLRLQKREFLGSPQKAMFWTMIISVTNNLEGKIEPLSYSDAVKIAALIRQSTQNANRGEYAPAELEWLNVFATPEKIQDEV